MKTLNHYIQAVNYRFNKYIYQKKGWKTNRHIIIIESDDWGSIRMPSKEVYNRLLKNGYAVDKCHYCSNDSLESPEDLSYLYEVLLRYKDCKGNHPIVTANTVMCNPNFEEIKENSYEKYVRETFIDTYMKYGFNNMIALWNYGIKNKIFYPQLHGLEHLNVDRWMEFLRKGSKETLYAFELGLFGLSTIVVKEKRKSYMAAFDMDNRNEIERQKDRINQSTKLFYDIFGYISESFIFPNYTWSKELECTLWKNNIKYIQGGIAQKNPIGKNIYHYIGQNNNKGQIYLVRNCSFEPSASRNKNWVDSCLYDIEKSFTYYKPAIVSSHRVNFIGSINEENRNKNLHLLDKLLYTILRKWPDVEFITSDVLGDLIISNNND